MEVYLTLLALFVAGIGTFIYFERRCDALVKCVDNVERSVLVLQDSTKLLHERVATMEDDFDLLALNFDNDVNDIRTLLESVDASGTNVKGTIDEYASRSEFEERIEKFRSELNTPTYPENTAQSLHPGVYNLPHETVVDTPLRVAEEYAE